MVLTLCTVAAGRFLPFGLNLFLPVLHVDILNELLQRENRVLHFWTMKKRRLDQCQQYVVFERSAKQVRKAPAAILQRHIYTLYL